MGGLGDYSFLIYIIVVLIASWMIVGKLTLLFATLKVIKELGRVKYFMLILMAS